MFLEFNHILIISQFFTPGGRKRYVLRSILLAGDSDIHMITDLHMYNRTSS